MRGPENQGTGSYSVSVNVVAVVLILLSVIPIWLSERLAGGVETAGSR